MGSLLVVELKADPQDRVADLVLLLAHIKQRLTKVSTQVQVRPLIEGFISLISAVVQLLAELPAALPRLFMGVRGSRAVKYPLSMD